jgi:hypothetical protein
MLGHLLGEGGPSDEDHVAAGGEETAAQEAADGAGAHHSDSTEATSAWPAVA